MHELQATTDLANSTLTLERKIDAPLNAVWGAFTTKEGFESWWGPEGWQTTTGAFDFTPGGRVHYEMKCIDEAQGEWFGKSSWGVMELQEIDSPRSFTYIDYFSDETGALDTTMPALTVTNTFSEVNNTTLFTSRSTGATPDEITQLLDMGMVEGFASQLRKLDALLAT